MGKKRKDDGKELLRKLEKIKKGRGNEVWMFGFQGWKDRGRTTDLEKERN